MAGTLRDAVHLGTGALIGAYVQDPRKTWGAKGMSPEEKERRVRKVRLGGALRGLTYVGGYKAIGRSPDAKHIAPIVSAIDGLSTYATDDETFLRRTHSRKKNESKEDYARRLTAARRNRALARGVMTGTIYGGIQNYASEAKKFKDSQEKFRRESARFDEEFREQFNQAFGGGHAGNAASAGRAYAPTSADEYKRSVLPALIDKYRGTGLDTSELLQASNKAELEAALKRAHRKASLKAHPDRGGNAEAMARLNALNDELREGMSKLAFYRTLYARAR
jgi:hypothetical protein